MSDKPTVYVCVTGSNGHDVAGTLLLDSGEAPWGHMSSSREWLRLDLTENFGRREELERRYPDGYEVQVLDIEDEIPADVMARHQEWRTKPERAR